MGANTSESGKTVEKHGQGTQTDPSGQTYVGTFKNGIFHGEGNTPSEMVTNMLVRSRMVKNTDRAQKPMLNGDTYVGRSKKILPDGEGTFTMPMEINISVISGQVCVWHGDLHV